MVSEPFIPANDGVLITVEDLTMAYGARVIMQNVSFTINYGEIMIIMGGSGCGKSTLLRHMIGLKMPYRGRILFGVADISRVDDAQRRRLLASFGVLYQGGALWSSMTLEENVALPLGEFTDLDARAIRDLVSLKLALVGLDGYQSYYPSEISGGMRKRAALARAIALDPEILFFDEPSAGLDPVSSRRLDDLILEIRDTMNTTIVVVTHELASIFAISDNAVYLDAVTKTMLACGDPRDMAKDPPDPRIYEFLTRGET